MKKYNGIHKISDNKFLNLFKLDALTDKGNPFSYYFVSRNEEKKLKLLTKNLTSEGVVIYPVWKQEPDKLIMIRQYRYPLDEYLYELPAGLIDDGETPEEAAVREMKEETGMHFSVYTGGSASYRRSFFMGAGFTDESCNAVFGYADGDISSVYLEESETIQVLIVDKKEAARILREERVSLRAAYLLINFLHAEEENPFAFLSQ